MSDLIASGPFPGTQYQASETGAVWHEDREVTLASGGPGSQLYRTYNAVFDSTTGTWLQHDTTLPGYATVQNPDGSIHYYTLDTTTGLWLGSGNNTVYNAVDFGMDPASSDNTAALQAAVTAALDGGGGVIFIPAGTYQLSGVTDLDFTGVPGEDPGFVIMGAGASTQLNQTDVTKDVFSISGVTSGKGVRFKDLRISYTTTETTPETLLAAIRVASGCQNVTCERVYFKDCPQAFDTAGLQCGLFNCTIAYNNFAASETIVPTMVNFNGTENYIDSCIINQQPQDSESDPGPAGCIGVLIVPGGGAYYITNTHISDFTQGIVVNDGPNLTRVFCSNVICESWTNSLAIQRTGSQNISQVYCDDCLFARTNGSTDDTSIGVLIDTGGGENSTVGEIFLNNCMCFQWNVAGVQINKGQKIVITGGRFGSNGLGEGSTGGGIAIIGTADDVTINGVDLTPKVVGPDFPNQAYALSITAAVNGLYVRGCNMSGYSGSGPLYLSSPGTAIEITDCAGYNDLGTIVSTTAPATTAHFNGSAFSPPYFGPVTFYTKNSPNATITHIKMNGSDTNLLSGTFTIGTGAAYAEIDYTGIAGNKPLFLLVGQ